MKKVASDENRHYLFYRDMVSAALEVDPSGMVVAIERQVRNFEMPGTGIMDFEAHAKAIAKAGIYDFAVHHDQILQPVVLRHWGIEELEGLDAEAEQARAALVQRIGRIGKAGRRFAARRDEAKQKELAAV
jgi:acyl-[acyl-carrier-protein] desaturase